jgi:outer membrane protein assembly factor BamB
MKPPQIIKLPRQHRDLRAPLLFDSRSIFISNYRYQTVVLDRRTFEVRGVTEGELEALHDGVLVVRSVKRQSLLGLSADDGAEKWQGPFAPFIHVVLKDHVSFIQDNTLMLVRPQDGVAVALQPPFPVGSFSVAGNVVLVAEASGPDRPPNHRQVCGCDLQTRRMLWQREFTGAADAAAEPKHFNFARGETSGDHFFFIQGRTLSACRAASGEVRWKVPFDPGSYLPIVASDRVLDWFGERLVGRDTASGEVVFETPHPALRKDMKLHFGLVHGRSAVVLLNGVLEVIDLDSGAVVNRYERQDGFEDVAMIDGRLVGITSREIRIFDDSIFAPSRPRVEKGPRAIPKPRAFKSERLVAEVVGGATADPLVFETAPRIKVHGVDRFHAPVFADGVVVVGADPIGLYALTPSSYQLLWQAPDIKIETPQAHAGFVLLPDWPNQVLRGLRIESGKPGWTTESRSRYFPSGDFVVVIAGEPARVQVFDPRPARVVLEFDAPLPSLAGVCERVAVLSELGEPLFVAMDLRDGRELWRRDFPADATGDLPIVSAVQDGVIVLERRDGLEGRSLQTGDVIWNHPGGFAVSVNHTWWSHYEGEDFGLLDIRSGEITVFATKRGAGRGAYLGGTFDGYVVGFAGNGVYFFDPARPIQKLPLKLQPETRAIQAGEDLILSFDGALEALRRIR